METKRMFESSESEFPMEERVLCGTRRLNDVLALGRVDGSTYTLRSDQANVFNDFAMYLLDVVTRSSSDDDSLSMARIVLPPRTGKTVIAAHCIGATALRTVFIVSTRALVDQTVVEFRAKLPGVPVGTYYGEEKDLVEYGINVTTYAILLQEWRSRHCLPPQIRHSALIFVDEAHRSMTGRRLTVLREGFDSKAIRIALTATPDYSDERRLAYFFPELIHEITLAEAVQLDLLAPLRVWVYEIDEDASRVEVVAGDYREDTISRLMSSAPFFRAAEMLRYAPGNVEQRALVCCRTRQQAYDLYKYLCEHRPEGRPEPGLILGETSTSDRREILRKYELGRIDTLISVGVLIEGWNSPFCKVLIDLAPSLSLVRATQKFFRPMTRWDEHEASIYVLIPKNLPQVPILPMELLHWSGETYESGTLIAGSTRWRDGTMPSLNRHKITPIESVKLLSRVLVSARFEKPALDPKNLGQVQQVMESNPATCRGDELCGIQRFRWLFFSHPLFVGRGEQLLRYLGVALNRESYLAYMARLFPDATANLFLTYNYCNLDPVVTCQDELAVFYHELLSGSGEGGCVDPIFDHTWRALAGPVAYEPDTDPEKEFAHQGELVSVVFNTLIPQLEPGLRDIIARRYGLYGASIDTYRAIARDHGIVPERVRQLEYSALRKLRTSLRHRGLLQEFID